MIPYYIFKDINEKIYCSCRLPKNEVIFPYVHRLPIYTGQQLA